MNLPIAPPAFDATTGPKQRHRADLGAVAVVAAAVAARAGAVVTVISQVVMAVLVCVCVFGGAAMQSHEDVKCREVPSAAGCDG